MKKLIAFFKDEDGLETVEWAVIAALVGLALGYAIARSRWGL